MSDDTRVPRPGEPVRGSDSGQPIMVLFDLMGRRWAMGVLWQLGDGPQSFRGLQARCHSVSPTVLNTRLKELRSAGLVETGPGGYRLTGDGEILLSHLHPLGSWARDWCATLAKPGTD